MPQDCRNHIGLNPPNSNSTCSYMQRNSFEGQCLATVTIFPAFKHLLLSIKCERKEQLRSDNSDWAAWHCATCMIHSSLAASYCSTVAALWTPVLCGSYSAPGKDWGHPCLNHHSSMKAHWWPFHPPTALHLFLEVFIFWFFSTVVTHIGLQHHSPLLYFIFTAPLWDELHSKWMAGPGSRWSM